MSIYKFKNSAQSLQTLELSTKKLRDPKSEPQTQFQEPLHLGNPAARQKHKHSSGPELGQSGPVVVGSGLSCTGIMWGAGVPKIKGAILGYT